jgi:hypothetical protein
MKQSIRALGWAVTLSTFILIVFLVFAFYSVFQLFMVQGVRFGEFKMNATEDEVTLSIPVLVENTENFDVNDFQITTIFKDYYGSVISEKSTVILEVPKGQITSTTHNLTLSFHNIFANRTYLLFNDTEFKIDFSIGFKYAYILGFMMSLKNMSMPWGAPLYGLRVISINPVPVNETYFLMELQLEVENHSFLDAGAILNITVYNESGKQVGIGTGGIFVPQGQRLTSSQAFIELTDPASYTGSGYAEISMKIPGVLEPIELGRVYYG